MKELDMNAIATKTRSWTRLCAGDKFIFAGRSYRMTNLDENGFIHAVNLVTDEAGFFSYDFRTMAPVELI